MTAQRKRGAKDALVKALEDDVASALAGRSTPLRMRRNLILAASGGGGRREVTSLLMTV